MRSFTLVLALFAALALSSPLNKRQVFTDLKIVTVTEWVTAGAVTADAYAASTTTYHHYRRPNEPASSSAAPAPVSTPASSSEAPAPVAPAPAPSTAAAELATSAPPPPASSSPTASTAALPASSAAPASTGGDTYQNDVLNSHNIHRSNHSAPALTWDDNLASIAAQIASSCIYAHNTAAGGGGYGQNIGAGTSAADIAVMITDRMYNDEIMAYPQPWGVDSPDMSNFEEWGHFSQIVWDKTTSVGCATQVCPSLVNIPPCTDPSEACIPPIFSVCNYSPAGNFAGEYSNVGAPLGQPVVTA